MAADRRQADVVIDVAVEDPGQGRWPPRAVSRFPHDSHAASRTSLSGSFTAARRTASAALDWIFAQGADDLGTDQRVLLVLDVAGQLLSDQLLLGRHSLTAAVLASSRKSRIRCVGGITPASPSGSSFLTDETEWAQPAAATIAQQSSGSSRGPESNIHPCSSPRGKQECSETMKECRGRDYIIGSGFCQDEGGSGKKYNRGGLGDRGKDVERRLDAAFVPPGTMKNVLRGLHACQPSGSVVASALTLVGHGGQSRRSQ